MNEKVICINQFELLLFSVALIAAVILYLVDASKGKTILYLCGACPETMCIKE
jgi:hypothetical protein